MIKKLWHDPVLSKVIAVAIIGGASFIPGFWPTIWLFLQFVYSLLTTLLLIPVWLLLLAIPFLLFVIPFIGSLRAEPEPGFMSYISDEIFEINWSWRWLSSSINGSGYTLHDLTPRCPSCSALLEVNDYNSSWVVCVNENCHWEWERQHQDSSRMVGSAELVSKVRNEIDRRMHAGERGR